VIADRDFPVDALLHHALVDALVAAGDDHQSILRLEASHHRLREPLALRRHQNHQRARDTRILLPLHRRADGGLQGLRHHHHSRTAAVGPVVHPAVGVRREFPRVPRLQSEEPILERAPRDAVMRHRLEHLGEDRDHVVVLHASSQSTAMRRASPSTDFTYSATKGIIRSIVPLTTITLVPPVSKKPSTAPSERPWPSRTSKPTRSTW